MKKLSTIFILMAASFAAYPQSAEKGSKFTLYASVGPNFYVNNFDYFKKYVDPVNFSISARVLWEPGNKVSIGLRTGYYQVYRANFTGPASSKFSLTAVPIQTFFSMRFGKGLYVYYGLGPSICTNKISTNAGEYLNDTIISLADMSIGTGYTWKLKNKISLGAEGEYFRSSKSNDNLFTVMFVARVPFSAIF